MHWHIYTFNGNIGVVESRITSGLSLIERFKYFSFPGGISGGISRENREGIEKKTNNRWLPQATEREKV